MKEATLTRFKVSETETIGRFVYEEEYKLYSVENPWLGNTPWTSCIPAGCYMVQRKDSPKYGKDMWMVQNVLNRSDILFHVANTADNVSGCIGLGMTVYAGLTGVGSSSAAIQGFYQETAPIDEFVLTIEEGICRD